MFFREHPGIAEALVSESCDKRFSPSTYITQNGDRSYTVGWYPRVNRRQFDRDFDQLADAATDYVLFTLGKGRWAPPLRMANDRQT